MRRVMILVPLVVAAVLAAMVVVVSMPAGAAATDRLPDLRMYRLTGLQIEKTPDGRKHLRFNSIIVNVGAGNFEVRGERPDTSASTITTTQQRIFDDSGDFRDVPTDAVMYYSGDGHNHWHVLDLQDYVLSRLDNGVKVGTGAKHGFCFYDNYEFGSTQPAYYTRAGGRACGLEDDLRVIMGLSVGWGDRYRWSLLDQYIDVTGLTSGRYRLLAVADPDDWFLESDNANNFTWVNIQLNGDQVSVLKYGPSAQPLG